MELPIALFVTFLGLTIFLTIIGIARRVPALIVASGIFLLFWAITTDNIIVDYNINAVGETAIIVHEQLLSNVQISMRGDGTNSTGQIILANNELIGREIDTITLFLFKFGNPTGTITVGTMGSTAGTFNQVFNTIDAGVLTTDITQYNFTLPANTHYTIQEDERIGLLFNGGDIDNLVRVRYWTGSSVLANENLQTSSTTTWSDFPTSDLAYRTWNNIPSVDTTPILFEFTEIPKMAFALFGGIMILSGAIIAFREF